MKKKIILFIMFTLMCALPFKIDAMQLVVKLTDDVKYTLEVESNETIENVKNRIYDNEPIPVESQILKFNNVVLANNMILSDYSIQEEDVLDLEVKGIIVDGEVLSNENPNNTDNTAVYNDEDKTLTLNNYSGEAISYYGTKVLNIILKGENTIESFGYGIYSLVGDVNITGTGSLEIDEATIGITAYEKVIFNADIIINSMLFGIITENDVIINGGNVNINSEMAGIFVTGTGSLIINGGKIDILAGKDGEGAAIVLIKTNDNQEINIDDKMQVIAEGYSIMDATIDYMDEYNGLTFSKSKANIILDDGVETENVAYQLVIKPKNKVVFNTLGGNTINSIYLEDNKTITKPVNPTKEDYAFVGWYEDETLTKEFNFDTQITKDITLYAKWNKVENFTYDITYGDKQKLPIGKIKSYILKIDGDYSLFESIKIGDLDLIKDEDYKITEGSTIITFTDKGLKKLNTLSNGEYKINIKYSNEKEVIGKLTIIKNEINPKTGDNVILYLIIGVISLIGLIGCILSLNNKKIINFE